jgi:hypothetical protein
MKKLSSSIALLLLLIFVLSLISVPNTHADTIPTYTYIAVSPDPAGIGQDVTVIVWMDKAEPTASGPFGGRWEFTVKVTKPGGSTENLGPYTADPSSYAYFSYTPDETGTYTFEANFAGKHVVGVGIIPPFLPVDDNYEPSSFTTTLTVQDEPATSFPQSSLPSSFWTRPINAQNQDWYKIAGNWLGQGTGSFGYMYYNSSGNFNPYTQGPETPHILWTKPVDFGGLIGGEFGATTTSVYYTGKSYEPKFTPPVIMNGVLYYNAPSPPRMGFHAVDLRTGETIWWQNSTGGAIDVLGNPTLPTYGYIGITMGQIYNYKSPNQIGGIPYLWRMPNFQSVGLQLAASDWYMYDAVTGNLILTVTNTTSAGYTVQGTNGELLIYYTGSNWLAMWNSSKCIGVAAPFSTAAWLWRPKVAEVLDWRQGLEWNVTTQFYPMQAINQIDSGVILATTGNYFAPQNWQWEIGYDAETGQQRWAVNRTMPKGTTSFGRMGPASEGIYTMFDKGAMQWYGYSILSGTKVWGPSVPYENPWGSQPLSANAAYELVIGHSLDGIHALDITTGDRIWDFYGDKSGVDFPGFSNYPFLGARPTIADGKAYVSTGNSHSDPLFRGARMYCINVTTGELLWRINGFYRDSLPIADGILVAHNAYDNQLCAFGKGPSATTVNVQTDVISHGESVLLTGFVSDVSAGAKRKVESGEFNMVAAVSDESMGPWMEYIYMQQPKPQNATGVEIIITVLDPNNNCYDVGTTTSDANGFYKIAFTPEVPGEYTVYSTFEGSGSFWSSQSITAINVEEAPVATPEPTPAPASVADLYFLPVSIGIIVAIVVIGLVIILMLRKR